MHNLGNVVRFEVMRSLKKWSFWISLLSFPVMIGIVYGLVFLSTATSQQKLSDLNKADINNIQVIDNSGLISPEVATALKLELVPNSQKEMALKNVKTGNSDLLIVFPTNPAKEATETFGKEISIFENEKYSIAANTILKTAASSYVANEKALPILATQNIETKNITFKNGEPLAGIERIIAPIMFLAVFYLVLILLSNQMVVSTTEEKENRVTEIILTTIESRTLITGKIISLFILGFIQILVIVLPIIIATALFKTDINQALTGSASVDFLTDATMTMHQFAVGFFAMTGGLAMLTGLLVAIGAAVPTAKEANNFLGVVIVAMFIPLYVFMTIITEPTSLVVQILSYFPLSAPVTIMVQNAFGVLNPTVAIISIAIIWLTAAIFLIIAARIFKYGTLEYNRSLSLKELTNKKYRA